jgi:hypothetical protein
VCRLIAACDHSHPQVSILYQARCKGRPRGIPLSSFTSARSKFWKRCNQRTSGFFIGCFVSEDAITPNALWRRWRGFSRGWRARP